jgi:hypothetical protein
VYRILQFQAILPPVVELLNSKRNKKMARAKRNTTCVIEQKQNDVQFEKARVQEASSSAFNSMITYS